MMMIRHLLCVRHISKSFDPCHHDIYQNTISAVYFLENRFHPQNINHRQLDQWKVCNNTCWIQCKLEYITRCSMTSGSRCRVFLSFCFKHLHNVTYCERWKERIVSVFMMSWMCVNSLRTAVLSMRSDFDIWTPQSYYGDDTRSLVFVGITDHLTTLW